VTRRFIPAELDALLLRKGLDNAELARRTGMSHVTIAKIRRGESVYMSTVRRFLAVVEAAPDVPLAVELTEAVA